MNKPFGVQWAADARTWKWWAPFDATARECVAPNADALTMVAYACVGYHVVQNAWSFCPAYKKLSEIDARTLNSRADMDEAQKAIDGTVLITNRLSGTVIRLAPALNLLESVVSWFVREGRGETICVLCWDRAEGSFYVEGERADCRVVLFQGREVAEGEAGDSVDYHLGRHPNAVMHSTD